jgi:hypothetical protein
MMVLLIILANLVSVREYKRFRCVINVPSYVTIDCVVDYLVQFDGIQQDMDDKF